MKAAILNTQSRAKRSLNRSKLRLDKKYSSFSLNKSRKSIVPLKRSKPLTNEEIINIQESERQKQKGIKNELEIQEELNKMKVKSINGSQSQSDYPHENVHEALQKSLSKNRK